jgi:5-amino-6-(5-phosphoribosylamino)uracil reductase
MVVSADGSVTDQEQWTDGLGGPADLRVFRALRALSDGIMVGAGTIRTGRVGPHRPTAELRAEREALGKPPTAPVIVVSRSLRLDWSHRLFVAAETSPTIVVTSAAGAAAGRSGNEGRVRLLVAGETEVDLAEAVRLLRTELGLRHLLCEGGPTLATSMIARNLVDELCLTVAPTLVGGRHHTPLLADLEKRVDLVLAGLYEEDATLFLRYQLP